MLQTALKRVSGNTGTNLHILHAIYRVNNW